MGPGRGGIQPAEHLDRGLHALACSRASGLWAGFKIVTSVADGVGTAAVAPDRVMPVMPTVEWNGRPYEHVPNGNLLAPASVEMERTLSAGDRSPETLWTAKTMGFSDQQIAMLSGRTRAQVKFQRPQKIGSTKNGGCSIAAGDSLRLGYYPLVPGSGVRVRDNSLANTLSSTSESEWVLT